MINIAYKTAMAFILALIAAAAPAGASASLRNSDDAIISTPVAYGDLDLSRAEDVERLYRRVELRAGRLCREFSSVTATQKMLKKCRDEIVDANQVKIENAVKETRRNRVE